MDKSETYVKMSGKAEEIQNGWQPQVDDYWCWFSCPERIYLIQHYLPVVGERTKEGNCKVWLPRQDQLQEMIEVVDPKPHKLIKMLWDWVAITGNTQFESMEQLWLAFVMKDNGEVWTGEDWQKERQEVKR